MYMRTHGIQIKKCKVECGVGAPIVVELQFSMVHLWKWNKVGVWYSTQPHSTSGIPHSGHLRSTYVVVELQRGAPQASLRTNVQTYIIIRTTYISMHRKCESIYILTFDFWNSFSGGMSQKEILREYLFCFELLVFFSFNLSSEK